MISRPRPRCVSYSVLSRGSSSVHGPDQLAQQVDQHDLALQVGRAEGPAVRGREGEVERLADLGPRQELDPGRAGFLERPGRSGRLGFAAGLGRDDLDAQPPDAVEGQLVGIEPEFVQAEHDAGERGRSAPAPFA